jgi:hypothetical protein
VLTCPSLLQCCWSYRADVAEYVNQLCDGVTALYRCASCLRCCGFNQPLGKVTGPLPAAGGYMHTMSRIFIAFEIFPHMDAPLLSCRRVVSADAPDMVRLLLESGAVPAIRVKDRGRWTSALHLAAQHK